jgi:hypothetical protein
MRKVALDVRIWEALTQRDTPCQEHSSSIHK